MQESQADEGLDRKEHGLREAVKVASEAGMKRHLFEVSVVTVRRLAKRNECGDRPRVQTQVKEEPRSE